MQRCTRGVAPLARAGRWDTFCWRLLARSSSRLAPCSPRLVRTRQQGVEAAGVAGEAGDAVVVCEGGQKGLGKHAVQLDCRQARRQGAKRVTMRRGDAAAKVATRGLG